MATEHGAAAWAEARRVAGEMGSRTLGLDLTPMFRALMAARLEGVKVGLAAAAAACDEHSERAGAHARTAQHDPEVDPLPSTYAAMSHALVASAIRELDPEKL